MELEAVLESAFLHTYTFSYTLLRFSLNFHYSVSYEAKHIRFVNRALNLDSKERSNKSNNTIRKHNISIDTFCLFYSNLTSTSFFLQKLKIQGCEIILTLVSRVVDSLLTSWVFSETVMNVVCAWVGLGGRGK